MKAVVDGREGHGQRRDLQGRRKVLGQSGAGAEHDPKVSLGCPFVLARCDSCSKSKSARWLDIDQTARAGGGWTYEVVRVSHGLARSDQIERGWRAKHAVAVESQNAYVELDYVFFFTSTRSILCCLCRSTIPKSSLLCLRTSLLTTTTTTTIITLLFPTIYCFSCCSIRGKPCIELTGGCTSPYPSSNGSRPKPTTEPS